MNAGGQHASRLAGRYGITRLVLAEVTARQQATASHDEPSPPVQRRIKALTSSGPGGST
jgi:hypothetical protein